MKSRYFPGWVAVIAMSWAVNVSAATVFLEDFEGYTSFPDQIPSGDPGNKGIPRISEGAAEIWYGGRFETADNGTIDSDLYIQKYGGGSNSSHTGRFEDDAGILFRISTTNLDNIVLSFDWRTFLAETGDRFVAGYHVGPIPGFGICTGNGEPGCFADLRSSLPWYTSQTGGTLTGNWTQLLRAYSSNNWNHQSYMLPDAVENQSEVWFAFWLDNGEGDYGKLDNIKIMATAPVPIPAAIWLFVSGIAGIGALAYRRTTA